MSKTRLDAQLSFVLHAHPYRETSLILDVLSRDHGRLAMVARGARRPRSALRGVLLAFVPLEISWFGSGEVRTLMKAEWLGGQALLTGSALLCGYYLNELLLRLTPREDPHPALFDHYRQTLRALSSQASAEPLLREFEVVLLRELGYAIRTLSEDDRPLESSAEYTYFADRGPVPAREDSALPKLTGAELIAISQCQFDSPRTLAKAKILMRYLINHHLGGASLQSRRVFMELQEL
jgi:DNA repair protein RecO (recombination protein O)